MTQAFSDRADFRRIGLDGERLSINSVISKTFMELTEEGTIAAAAAAGNHFLIIKIIK